MNDVIYLVIVKVGKNMNKIFKRCLLLLSTVIFTFAFVGGVDAATYHKGSKIIYFKDFGLGSGHKSYYNKKVDNAIAYCPETAKSAPPDKSTVNPIGSVYNTQSYVEGQIILIGRARYSGQKEYMYIQQALNCYLRYNKSYLGGCNSEINGIINEAKASVGNYKYNSDSASASLPAVGIKSSSASLTKTANSTSQNATYVSSAITVSGLNNGNYGSVGTNYTASTVPSYTVALSNSVNGSSVKLCTNAEGTAGCITNGGRITANGTYYLIVTNAGINGGSTSVRIAGSNTSTYPSAKTWLFKNKHQRLVTYTGDSAKVTRSVSAAGNFKYAPAEKYSVAITKLDDTGEILPGASLRLYTAADENGKNDTVTLCSTSASDSKGTCTKTGITDSDANKYSNGRYICYSETTTPKGYVNITPHCDPITLGSKKYYYKMDVASSDETVSTEADYLKAKSYEQGTDLKYQFHTGTGTAASDYTYSTSSKMYKYVYEDGRPAEYKTTDEEFKHVTVVGEGDEETTVTEWYMEDGDTRINITVTELEGTLVCHNETAGVSTNTDYCSGDYQYTEVTFSSGNAIINVGNALNYVNISKKAITGDDEVPGATLSIFKAGSDGKCTTQLAKAKNFVYSPYVEPESSGSGSSGGSSSGDEGSSGGSSDDIDDQDTEEGNDSGIDIANNGLEWKSSNTSATIYGLDPGNYCLQEQVPPNGYKVNPTVVKFKMDESGEVTVTSRDYYDEESKTLILRDEYTKISISKADIVTTKEIPGAELKICEAAENDQGKYEAISTETGEESECAPDLLADGTEAIWTSGTTPHEIIGLGAGTYYLVETTAPEGYAKAEAILFKLKEDGTLTDINGKSLADNKITMYDSHEVVKVPNTMANASLIISILGSIFIAISVGGYLWTNRKRENLSC